MRIRNLPLIVGTVLLTLFAVTSYNLVLQSRRSVRSQAYVNPPFKVLLNQERVTPDPLYDPSPASSTLYDRVRVLNAAGKVVYLDARKTPVLFEAYWCPHCQRTLVLLAKNRTALKQFPVLVSAGFAPGTTFSTAARLSAQEMKTFRIRNVKLYILLGSLSATAVPEFPTLAFSAGGKFYTLRGEHVLSAWRSALSG